MSHLFQLSNDPRPLIPAMAAWNRVGHESHEPATCDLYMLIVHKYYLNPILPGYETDTQLLVW